MGMTAARRAGPLWGRSLASRLRAAAGPTGSVRAQAVARAAVVGVSLGMSAGLALVVRLVTTVAG